MVRVKRGKSAHKRRKNILKHTKGFRWGRKSKYALAKDAFKHAGRYGYRDRRTKKREIRKLWQIKINAGGKKQGLSYNKLIHGLKEKKIEIDRKILAQLAEKYPEIFEKIIEQVK